MFCEKCGNQVSSVDKFCPKCGAAIEPEISAENPIDTGIASDAAAPVGKFAAVRDLIISWVKIVVATKKVVPLALTAVVLVAFISSFAYIKNAVMQLFLNSDRYLSYVVTSNAEDFTDTIANSAEIYKEMYTKGISGTGDVEFKKGDAFADLIYDLSGEDIDDYIDWLDSAAVSVDFKGKDDVYGVSAGVKVNGVDLGKLDYVVDYENFMFYMGVPDYSSEYIEADLEEISGMSGGEYEEIQEQMKAILEAFPKEATLRKMLNRYIKAVANGFNDVEESKDTISAGGLSQKVTRLSFDVDGELVQNIAINVLREAQKDKELKKFLERLFDNVDAGVDADDIWDGIEEALDDIEDMDSDDLYFADAASVDVFVNSKGEIVGLAVDADEFTLEAYNVQKGNKFAETFEVKAEGIAIVCEGEGKVFGNKRTGTYELGASAYGMKLDIVEIDIEKLDVKKMKKGLTNGTITIRFADDIADTLNMISSYAYEYDLFDEDIIEVIADLELTIKSKQKSFKDYDATITLKYDGDVALEINSKSKLGGAKKPKIPSKTVDAYDIEDWAYELDVDKLIKKLEKANFPDEAIEALEDELD